LTMCKPGVCKVWSHEQVTSKRSRGVSVLGRRSEARWAIGLRQPTGDGVGENAKRCVENRAWLLSAMRAGVEDCLSGSVKRATRGHNIQRPAYFSCFPGRPVKSYACLQSVCSWGVGVWRGEPTREILQRQTEHLFIEGRREKCSKHSGFMCFQMQAYGALLAMFLNIQTEKTGSEALRSCTAPFS
jgi:hypothetical protein